MPAIITHDFFGRDVYNELFRLIGGSKDEADAFLLGNQGPDPLFYSAISPTLRAVSELGGMMHEERPRQLIAALKKSIAASKPDERAIARAYALGFLCHYSLDSTMHPFVYSFEFSLCDAGVEGLTREDHSEVHALIESEFDELVLFAKRETTIAHFDPSKEILRASARVLHIVSAQYVYLAREVYGMDIPTELFAAGVRYFRLAQAAFHSTTGLKRNLIGRLEECVRRYSFFRAMSLQNIERTTSIFDNREHEPWENPFTGKRSTAGFWDLYAQALECAQHNIMAFDVPHFGDEEARVLTADLNFAGAPTEARIVKVEDVPPADAAPAATAATPAAAASGTTPTTTTTTSATQPRSAETPTTPTSAAPAAPATASSTTPTTAQEDSCSK